MIRARYPISTLVTILIATPLAAQLPRAEQVQPTNAVLSHRQEDPLIKERILERFETLLPELMRREGLTASHFTGGMKALLAHQK